MCHRALPAHQLMLPFCPQHQRVGGLVCKSLLQSVSITWGFTCTLKAGEPLLWAVKALGRGKTLPKDKMWLLPNQCHWQAHTSIAQSWPFPAHFPFDLLSCHAPAESKQMSERSAPRPPCPQPVPATPLWSRPRPLRAAVAVLFVGYRGGAWGGAPRSMI